MESRIERLCIERGLKMTGQRRVVARVLSDAGDHPDVEELYRRASALDQHISIATVYRTVRLFEEQGILERREGGRVEDGELDELAEVLHGAHQGAGADAVVDVGGAVVVGTRREEEDTEPIPIATSRGFLCRYFSFLPHKW